MQSTFERFREIFFVLLIDRTLQQLNLPPQPIRKIEALVLLLPLKAFAFCFGANLRGDRSPSACPYLRKNPACT